MKSSTLSVLADMIISGCPGGDVLYRVDNFEISTDRGSLTQSGIPIPLRHKTFELLTYLVRNRHRAVGRDELLGAIWPGTVVTDNSVAQCIRELRRALGDDVREPRFIRTVGRAGYHFVAPVSEIPVSVHTPDLPPPPRPVTDEIAKFSPLRKTALSALALAASVLLGWAGSQFGRNEANSRQAEESAVAFTSNLKAARAYLAGVELSRQYHPAEAIDQFQVAIRLDPDFLMARARIGYVYSVRWLWEEKGRPYLEDAYAARGKLNELSRLYILAWYDQAHRDYDGAIRDFRQLLAKFPKQTEAREELGRILLGEERYGEARSELELAIRNDPAAAQAHNILASLYMGTHEFGRAIGEARQFVKLQPAEVNAQDTLGLAYELANDFENAEKTYRAILDIQPKFVSRIHLANTLFRVGRWREAEKEMQRFIADAPSDAERQWGTDQLAVIALARGEFERALSLARTQPPEGYHDQEVLVALHRGNLAAADRILSARPLHADRGQRANRRLELYIEGERALAAHDAARAIQAFQQAVAQRTPIYAIDWYEDCLAGAYLRLGRYPEAVAEYRRVLAIYPGLATAWLGLAKAYSAQGDYPAARDAFAKVLRLWQHADDDVPVLAEARKALNHADIRMAALTVTSPRNIMNLRDFR